jgi:hypothetical protein
VRAIGARILGTMTVHDHAKRRPDKMRVKDMPPKTVALVGAVCLTTGWLLASMLAPPVARLQTLPERRTAARPAASPTQPAAAFTEELHWRLQQAPVAPVPRRNPFTFGSKPRGTVSPAGQPGASDAPAVSPAPLEVAPAPTGPIYSLAGIGSTSSADGVILTAVLSDGNTVHLVNAGQTVGGYKVVDVTEDSITLADSAGQQTILRLR